ncbi:ROK family protein [candidate division TA06 bacterium]|nr:ROK family protein [candidate division TA06 bacterium]
MSKLVDPLTLGVDLGGTKVETGVVDGEGRVLASHRHATDPARGADEIIASIVTCVKECLNQDASQARALGVGVAGQLEKSTGIVRNAPNLRWRDVPLRSQLEHALGLPVVVANDVTAIAFGEWQHGAGKNERDLVVLFVGTGIGGGIVSGGRLLEGGNNSAGELGHMTIVAGGRNCTCPNRGCMEAYAGGWAIAERAQEAVSRDTGKGKALTSLAGEIEKITSVHVSEAFHSGDSLAKHLMEETGEYLANGIVGIVNSFNPDKLILGGGVIEGTPELIQMVRDVVSKRALEASVEKLCIVKAQLGDQAGSIGAAAMARELVESKEIAHG